MAASTGSNMSHPVTEQEAARSILVQGLPLLDQELTESSIVQASANSDTVIYATQSIQGTHLISRHLMQQSRREGAHWSSLGDILLLNDNDQHSLSIATHECQLVVPLLHL